ncbi:MAG: heme-binding protein, partial [Gammaproteobacteria bacterium]|nr:heme-binding protein [Gammaproteobacteria bacterium]
MPNANPVISLAEAKTLIASALDKGAELGLKPLTVAVLDNGGCLKALECQDGASILRPKIAFGKAYGALCVGLGSRALHTRAEQQPYFVSAINALADGALVPVA